MEKLFFNEELVFFLCNYIIYREYIDEIEFILDINFNFYMSYLNFIV